MGHCALQVDCYVSPFVIQEVSRGDGSQVELRRAVVREMSVLALNEVIRELAAKYILALGLPERAALDAFHLAVAAWYNVDYVLSWNCKHIASGRVQKALQNLNRSFRRSYARFYARPKNLWRFEMWEDPIVKEVRKVRLELEREADYDVSTLYQRALELQNEVKAKLVSEPLPELTITTSNRA